MVFLKRTLIVVLAGVFLVSINACSGIKNTQGNNVNTMENLVSTQWLNEHLDDPDLIILDTTVLVNMSPEGGFSMVSGKAQFENEHIPNAKFADLLGNLSATNTEMKFVMPTPEHFRLAIGELGIDNDSRVVLYESANQSWSARLWWMLRWAGHENVAILDGGLKAWKAEGKPLSNKQPSYIKKSYSLHLKPEIIAYQDEVLLAIEDEQVEIVDSLAEVHYLGQFSMYPRKGHIATAINLDASKMIDESGQYIGNDELDLLFGKSQNKRIITYCGGGVAASSTAFALVNAGYKNVAVYMGSLQEWTADANNPMEVGEH